MSWCSNVPVSHCPGFPVSLCSIVLMSRCPSAPVSLGVRRHAKRGGVDGETHHSRDTQTHGHTNTGSYRGGAHCPPKSKYLRMIFPVFPFPPYFFLTFIELCFIALFFWKKTNKQPTIHFTIICNI